MQFFNAGFFTKLSWSIAISESFFLIVIHLDVQIFKDFHWTRQKMTKIKKDKIAIHADDS